MGKTKTKSILACAVLASVLAGGFGMWVSRVEAADETPVFKYKVDDEEEKTWYGQSNLILFGEGGVSDNGITLEVWGEGATNNYHIYGCYKSDTNNGKTVIFNSGKVGGVYGESPFGGDITNNTVKINGGSVRVVYGGDSAMDANMTDNKVEINGGEIFRIFGGYATGNVSGNRVEINNGMIGLVEERGTICGGYGKSTSDTLNNIIRINGGTVNGYIYGGYDNITADTDNVIEISGNIVEISGGTITGDIYGGYGKITVDTDKLEISNNIVEISGGSITGNIYGGYGNITVDTDKLEISNNIVEISGGSITGDIYGSYITSGTVSGNTVKISDGTINGDIYGGQSNGGDATGISVTINGGIFNGASLYGGVAGEGKTSSGNTLNVNTAINGNFSNVSGFQVMNFSVPAYYANSQDQSTVYQMLNVTAEGATSFDFSGVDIKVTNAPYLAAGDYITLIRGVNGTTFSLKDNIHYQVLQFPDYVELVYANGTPMPGTDYTVIQKDGNGNVLKQYCSNYGGKTYDSVVGNMNIGGLNTASYSNNEVVINKGTYTQSISGASASDDTAVTDNKVSVYGGTVSGAVYGGQSSSGNVSGNSVEINGGTISGGVYGGQSTSGAVKYNRVEINSGTVSGAVYGGQSGSGNATGNSVVIYDGQFSEGAKLYGGVTTGTSSSNTLFLNTAVNGTVNTVDNFQNIHFTVPSGLASGMTMLSVSTPMSLAGVLLVTDTGALSLTDGQTITLIQGVSETGFVPNVHYTVNNGKLIYKHIDETKDEVNDYTIRQWDKKYDSGNSGTYSVVRTEHYDNLLIQGNTTDGGLSNTSYSGNEVIIRKGTYEGKVNGAYYGTGTFDMTNNKVSVYGGTVNDAICGGLNYDGTGYFSGNVVNVFGGNIDGGVYGFYANFGTGDASDNVVNISGGTVAGAVGAAIKEGTIHNNIVRVTGGTITGGVDGGKSYGVGSDHGSSVVTDNLVIINDGTLNGGVCGGFGGDNASKASGNRVEINGGTINGGVYGGQSASGTVSGNRVEISGGMVGSTEKSQQIYGGQSTSGTVSGNRVEISGGTVSGTVYGGYSISGNISGNIVKVSGGNLIDATLYGWGGTNHESHSNNVLQIENPVAVKGIGNFASINLVLPENVADNTKILTMSNPVDLSGVAVNVYLNGQEPDTITLIDKVENSGTYNIWVGTDNSAELRDNYTISVDNGSLLLKANVVLWYRVGDEARRFASSSEPQSISDNSGKAVVLHRGAGNDNEYTGINITGALTVGAETTTGKSFLVSGDLTANGGVTVATKNTLNVAASNLKSDVTNNGTVNLGAGTLATGSTITGGTLNITGDVTANAALSVENMNVEQEATLTISADNLQITNGLINTGKTILKGGTLSCDITTTKQTYSDLEIEGEVLNNAEITQNGIRIKGSGTSFTTDADKIHTGQVDMLGGAVLNLTGGTIDFNITNEENTTAKIVKNATVGMSSSGRVGNLQVAGTLDMNGQTNKVTNLDLTATGTLDLKNNACETVVFENLTAAEGATVNFDAKFTADGDKISAETGSGKLALGSIGVKDDFVGNAGDTTTITFLTNGAANITLTGSAETVFGAYKYIFEPGKDAGTLKVTKDNGFSLHEVITNSKTGAGAVSNYSLKENYDVTENLGTLTRVDEDTPRSLVINGNNHTFDGKTTNAIGVNDGDTLGFKDVTVQGFSDNVAVNNAGTVELDGVTLKSGITGSGSTKIVGNTTLEAKVNQGIIVVEEKTLTTAADNLGGDVTNAGTMNLGEGTLASGSTITGGTLNITGDVTANADDIAGNTNTVAENKTLTFTGGTLNKAITNNGTVKLNGATLGGAYVTAGTLEFAKDMTINADNAAAVTNIVDSGVTLTVNGGTFDKKLDGSGTLNITGTLHYDTNAELVAAGTQKVGDRDIPVSNVNVTIANGGVMDLKDRESTPGGCINALTFSGGKLDFSGGYVGNLLIAKNLDASTNGGGFISFDVSATGNDKIGVLTSVASGSTLTLDTINVKGELAGEVAPQSGVSGSIVFAQDLSGQNVLDNLTIAGTTTVSGNYMYTFTQDASDKGKLNYKKEMGMGLMQVIQAKDINGTFNNDYAQIANYSFNGERGMNFEPYSQSKIDMLTENVKTDAENMNKRFGDLGTMGHATGATARTLTINGNGSALSGGVYAGVTVNNGDTFVLKNVRTVTDGAENKIATNNGTVLLSGSGTMDVKASVDGTGKLIVDGVDVVLGENYQYITGRTALTAAELTNLKAKVDGGTATEIERKEYEYGWKLNDDGSYVTTLSETTSASITQKDLEISSGSLTANASNLHITNGIVNNGKMTFTGGVLNTQVTGTGNLTFDGDVTTNANYIGVSGTNTITDINTLTLTDGTLVKVISGAGNVAIGDGQHEQSVSSAVGNFTNTGNLTVNAKGTLELTAGTLTKAITNNGTVKLDDVTLKSGITGTGSTKIVGNTTLEAKVNQGIIVDTGKTLTTAADNLGGDVTNGGTVNLGEGTLTTGSTITGGILNITGDVTANASDIAGETNTVAEEKTLTFNGGTLTKNVQGAGNVAIGDGTNVQTVSSNAGNFANTGNLTVSTNGILNLTAGAVNRQIDNNGTVKLNGATLEGAYITRGTLEFSKIMQVNADYVKATINQIDSGVTLTLADGTLSTALTGAGNVAIGDGTNEQTVNSDAGNFTNTGDLMVNAKGTLELTAGELNRTIINRGTVKLNGATLGSNCIFGGTLEFAADASYAGSYLTGNVNKVDSGVTLTLTDEKLPANASIENHGTVDLVSGTYDENFVQGAKDDGTVNLKADAVYQTTAGKVFTEGDAKGKSAGTISQESGSAATLLNFVSGILALTDEQYSLDYLVSAKNALNEFKYDATNLSQTELLMTGTLVNTGTVSLDTIAALGGGVILNDVEVTSDKANLIIGSTDTTGDYKNAVANGFGAGSLNLGTGTDKVTITNGKNLTLGGTEGGTLIKVNGEEKNVNVTVGNGTDASTFNIGNELTPAETKFKLPGTVTVKDNSEVNVKGQANITQALNMAGGEVAVAEGASLNVPEINVTNDAKMSGKIATDKLAGTSGKVIYVGNTNAAGHVSAKETKLNGGILFLDPVWKDGVGIEGATHFATETTTLDGAYVVGRNSVLTFGATNDDADTQFKTSGLKWGENDITAAAYVADNIDVAGGSLTVDGSLEQAPSMPDKGSVKFAEKSLFMVNGDNCQGSAAVTGVKKAEVAGSSQLFIANAVPNATYKILAGEGITSGWLEDNVIVNGLIEDLTVELDGTNKAYFNVITGNMGFDVDGTVMPNVAQAITADRGSKAYDALYKMVDVPSKAQQTANVNAYANLGENLGVTRGAYDVANMVGNAVTNHWDNNPSGSVEPPPLTGRHSGDVWAVYTHRKENVDGLKLGGMDAKYDTQYNGVVVGADLSKGFGIALNYTSGNVNNGLGGHNDAKYYGGSIYGRKAFGNLNLFGDVTYTHGKNELAQNGVEADAKTDTISAGLTAKYLVKAGKFGNIAPFAGVRYMRIDGKDYTDSLGVNRKADKINSVVVPVGLEYAGSFEIENSDWTWKPRLAVGYLFNLGNRDNDITMRYNGAEDIFGYDFADNGAFFANAGMVFERKNFSIGLGYEFMKSKNSRGRRWNVNANVKF